MSPRSFSVAIAILAFICTAAITGAEEMPKFQSLLAKEIGWHAKELKIITEGEVRVGVGHQDDHELVLVGVAKCDVPPSFFREHYHDVILATQATEGANQIGRIGSSPVAADFANLQFPENDLKDLKKCRSGKCNVKITAAAMAQIKTGIDWKNETALSNCNDILRKVLHERTSKYASSGLAELADYIDREQPRSAKVDLDKIFEYTPVIYESVPGFYEYIVDYPNKKLDNATSFLYWQIRNFGLKPTVSNNHVITYIPPPGVYDSQLLIAEVGIYSSHYFVASLGLLTVVTANLNDTGEAHYFLSVQRYRFDGKLGGLKRKMASGKLKDAFKKRLEQERDAISAAYEAGVMK